jgi:hypothetical protein
MTVLVAAEERAAMAQAEMTVAPPQEATVVAAALVVKEAVEVEVKEEEEEKEEKEVVEVVEAEAKEAPTRLLPAKSSNNTESLLDPSPCPARHKTRKVKTATPQASRSALTTSRNILAKPRFARARPKALTLP